MKQYIRTSKFFVKDRKRLQNEFQFHMHDFVDDCNKLGIPKKKDIFPSYRFHVRSLCKRLALFVYRIQKKLNILPRRNTKIIITATGGTIDENVFPYFWRYEIVPVVWDCWELAYPSLLKSIDLFDIKTVFTTSSIIAKRLQKDRNVNAYWIYEGIRQENYLKGDILFKRTIDVIELGRRHKSYHDILKKLERKGMKLTSSAIRLNGLLNENNLLFGNQKSLAQSLCQHKIMICFPRSITNPSIAGNIETLTQRYWEGMLSRCLLLGHAPNELVSVMGYNPVVEVDFDNAETQLEDILKNINSYQGLVDMNYQKAIEYSSWYSRIEMIKTVLQNS